MHRCHVTPSSWCEGGGVQLSAEVAHHLLDVLRLRVGERVVLFDGQGREAEAEIVAVTHRVPRLNLLTQVQRERPPLQILLIQAIPKGKHMELVVEKATEIGVTAILPVISERVVVRLDSGQRRDRCERWQRIADSAARQCGTPWIPRVHDIVDFSGIAAVTQEWDCLLIAAVTGGAVAHIHEAASAAWQSGGRRIALMIGPEGDWTPEEQKQAGLWGAEPVSLGDRVLRTETAALFGLSVLAATCRAVVPALP